jgi:hypothetical protein
MNQMVIVDITDKFNVISVDAIYCLMHLIPKFKIIIDLKTTAANCVPADKYQQFYVNSFVDHHTYTNCYLNLL